MSKDGKAAEARERLDGGGQGAGKARLLPDCTTSLRQSQLGNRPKHGQIRGDVWRKTISKSAGQMLRQPAAIAVDVSDLTAAELGGARWLEVLERDDCRCYRVSLSAFRAHGFALERGAGRQWALPLDYWDIDGQPAKRQPAKPSDDEPLQMSLWEARP